MELLPSEQMEFDRIVRTIREVYELYGFIPLDTPLIERQEVLLAKAGGETEKQIYCFRKGESDLALRFDLTVPLARYVSEHYGELTFPFRRYHIGKVYRGERPQQGRFREFYQCDIDVIGDDKLGLFYDAEMPCVINDIFRRLGWSSFVVRISNRKLISGVLSSIGAEDQVTEVLRIVDKLEKVSSEQVREQLSEVGLGNEEVEKILSFSEIKGEPREVINKLKELDIDDPVFRQGVAELEEVSRRMESMGMPRDRYCIDLSIARGLDYYTGTVYETTLEEYPEIGSICSGGRYDDLAAQYTNRKLPGVGISIGLTRLFSQLQSRGLLKEQRSTPSRVLVVSLSPDDNEVLKIASCLRQEGIAAEIGDTGKKVQKNLKYADRLGIPYVLLIGEDEIRKERFTLKDMRKGEQSEYGWTELTSFLKEGNDLGA